MLKCAEKNQMISWGKVKYFLDGSVPLKALYNVCHTLTGGGGNHARCQPAHQEQLGVQCLAQVHFDTLSGGTGNWTRNLPVTRRLLYLLPCHPACKFFFELQNVILSDWVVTAHKIHVMVDVICLITISQYHYDLLYRCVKLWSNIYEDVLFIILL